MVVIQALKRSGYSTGEMRSVPRSGRLWQRVELREVFGGQSIAEAAAFSSTYRTRRVPGIGTTCCSLRERPRDGDLRGRGAVAFADGSDPLDDREVRVDRLLA